MKTVDIRQAVVSISSPIGKAFSGLSKMTARMLAVVIDQVKDGKPVVGYGFISNGRYAGSGLLNARFLARLHEAKPDSFVNGAGYDPDPHRIWAVMMVNEKAGGHGERSVSRRRQRGRVEQ